jgi:sterol desaturase/sphingolipid hydroxylase (fatty acid hydroxylase superfamily)
MNIILSLFLGILSWSLTEYFLHRYMGHVVKRGLFYREHAKHHYVKDYFAPAYYKVRAALIVILITFTILQFFITRMNAFMFSLSYVGMYLTYERIHYLLHLKGPKNWYLSKMAIHHFSHHFDNDQRNHGVTSTLWDHLFGTYHNHQRRVEVPKKYQMVWMEDDLTKDLFGNEYKVLKKI